MHTVLSGPCGDSPDKQYKVYMECHGRSAHAYTDYTVKKVGVSIDDVSGPAVKRVFSGWAVLDGAGLLHTRTWEDTSSLRIKFFEREGDSGPELDRGFVLITKGSDGTFRVTQHSENVRIKSRNYFF